MCRLPPAREPYVAEAGQRLAEGLREENQRLKAERTSGMLVLRLDPKRVRATEFINRDERAFLESDPKFIELKESLRLHGQEQPIRVRPVADDAGADFEIVSGHRRHRAALALDVESEGGFPLYALLDGKGSSPAIWYSRCTARTRSGPTCQPSKKALCSKQWTEIAVCSLSRPIWPPRSA